MKKLKFALPAFALLTFALLGFTSCTKDNDTAPTPESEQVLVRFENELDHDLTDLVMYFPDSIQTNVGSILAGQTSDYIVFDYFEIGAEQDFRFPSGSLLGEYGQNMSFTAWSGMWCGTGVELKQLEPGKYTIRITKVSDEFYQILFE